MRALAPANDRLKTQSIIINHGINRIDLPMDEIMIMMMEIVIAKINIVALQA